MFAGLRKLWNNGAIRIIVCNSARHKVQTRSCLHDKRLDLGTRQTWESSDLCNKSADFECLQDCGSCETTEQSVSLFAIQQGTKSRLVHACMIRDWTLVPAKHEKVAIYAINPRISNVCRIAKVVKQRSNPYHCLQFSKAQSPNSFMLAW